VNLKDQLDTYCERFNRRDRAAALALFEDRSLFEFPLLGQRLVGRGEIDAGLSRIFEVTESAALLVLGHQESATMIIAEGRLDAKLYRDAVPVSIALAMALEARDGRISRLSVYLDARIHRLWSDGLLCAPSEGAGRAGDP
jgi:ketosteroid isomerase-like protein